MSAFSKKKSDKGNFPPKKAPTGALLLAFSLALVLALGLTFLAKSRQPQSLKDTTEINPLELISKNKEAVSNFLIQAAQPSVTVIFHEGNLVVKDLSSDHHICKVPLIELKRYQPEEAARYELLTKLDAF